MTKRQEGQPQQNGWRECKLGDVATVNPYEKLSKSVYSKKIAMEHIAPFEKYIREHSYEPYSGGVKFRNGDTLVARITPSLENGKTAFVDILESGEIGFGSTEFIVLRAKENLSDSHFLYYFAISPNFREVAIKSMTGSSGRQRVQIEVVENHNFYLPSLFEQQAIAEVLSSLDDKIDLLHRQNKTMEKLNRTLFKELFIEKVSESWQPVQLGTYVISNEFSVSSKDNIDEILYLDTGSLTEGKIYELQKIEYCAAPSRARRKVKHNDVLISMVRPNQKHYGIISNPPKNLIVSTGFSVISCKTICPYFIYYFLTAGDMTEYLHSVAEGSTSAYPSLVPSDIEKLEFQLPDSTTLKHFSDFASEAHAKIEHNYIEIKYLEKLRELLLPKLINGEIKVIT